jgi:hypothetical protein
MFPATSRYAGIETATRPGPDGLDIRYLRRRFPPAAPPTAILEHELVDGERLDHLAYRYFDHDPEQFWRICDANAALLPRELTAPPGRRLRIPSILEA